MNYLLEKKASRLGVRSSDPGALNGVDAEKLSASAKAMGDSHEADADCNPIQKSQLDSRCCSWNRGGLRGSFQTQPVMRKR